MSGTISCDIMIREGGVPGHESAILTRKRKIHKIKFRLALLLSK